LRGEPIFRAFLDGDEPRWGRIGGGGLERINYLGIVKYADAAQELAKVKLAYFNGIQHCTISFQKRG
jgi:hypothetical protein